MQQLVLKTYPIRLGMACNLKSYDFFVGTLRLVLSPILGKYSLKPSAASNLLVINHLLNENGS
jgi:hypothetical protein